MEEIGQSAWENGSRLNEYCSRTVQEIQEDHSPPISKVVWDAQPQLEVVDGVFKTTCGRNQGGSCVQANPNRSKHLEEDDIIEAQDIPDLEEEVDEAPKTHRLPTIKELDSSIPYPVQCTTESGIDLRPLVSVLLPVYKVVEDDTLWEPPKLLTEMAFNLNKKEVDHVGKLVGDGPYWGNMTHTFPTFAVGTQGWEPTGWEAFRLEEMANRLGCQLSK